MTALAANPFAQNKDLASRTEIEKERAVQEVQAAMVIAKRFPRDEAASMDRILKACTRSSLAEAAIYLYPKGGQHVTGPSIKLAETIAQSWGNIQYGIVETEKRGDSSSCQAYAWDLETNTRKVIEYQVDHKIKTKKGMKFLDDPRDIYELVANMGSRRVRNCILAIIPDDVTEAAERQARLTQQNQHEVTEESTGKMVEAFALLGVTEEMLIKRLGHKLEGMKSAQMIDLKRVYQTIKDGVGKISDFFHVLEPDNKMDQDVFKEKLNKGKKAASTKPKKTPEPESPSAGEPPNQGLLDELKQNFDNANNPEAFSIVKAAVKSHLEAADLGQSQYEEIIKYGTALYVERFDNKSKKT